MSSPSRPPTQPPVKRHPRCPAPQRSCPYSNCGCHRRASSSRTNIAAVGTPLQVSQISSGSSGINIYTSSPGQRKTATY